MELKIYNGEYFERGSTWYIVFTLIILLVVIFSVLSNNITWWVFVLLLAGGYLFYLTKIKDTITMTTWKNALQIGKATLPRNTLKWFVLEYHVEKEKIHNIVIIDNQKTNRIYTINDTEKNIQEFANELNWYIPMLENYDQWIFDKFLRKIKL